MWDSTFHLTPNEQSGVVDSIVEALTVRLRQRFPRAIGFGQVRSIRGRTSNTESYAFYLNGQGVLARRARSVKEAVEAFRQAIREDSLFAPVNAETPLRRSPRVAEKSRAMAVHPYGEPLGPVIASPGNRGRSPAQ